MLVRALIPVRDGGRDPRQVGEEFDVCERDALELEQLGAAEIVDPDYHAMRASDREAIDSGASAGLSLPGALASSGADDLNATLSGDLELARAELAKAGEEITRLTGERDAAQTDAAELRNLMDGATSEILQLKNRITELEASGGRTTMILPEVNVEMARDALRKIAADEGIAFDANDTKAELVTKIRAGRVTAKGE